jgi:hypothetical protein
MTKRTQFLSADDAEEYAVQHKAPCSDCPWSRKALPGWTGLLTTEEWLRVAHGEAVVECHTRRQEGEADHWECAGAAIYRANVCKTPRSQYILRLPADRTKVFATPKEFKDHHGS